MSRPRAFGGTSIKHNDLFLQEGKEFAESKSLLFMESSAKLNYQVSEIFNTIGELWPSTGRWELLCLLSLSSSGVFGAGRGVRKTNRECLG